MSISILIKNCHININIYQKLPYQYRYFQNFLIAIFIDSDIFKKSYRYFVDFINIPTKGNIDIFKKFLIDIDIFRNVFIDIDIFKKC